MQRMNHLAGGLLRQAEWSEVTISDTVIAGVTFSLPSTAHYQLPVVDAAGPLAAILRLRGFSLREKRIVLRALELWTEYPNLRFVNALPVSYAQRGMELASFGYRLRRIFRKYVLAVIGRTAWVLRRGVLVLVFGVCAEWYRESFSSL